MHMAVIIDVVLAAVLIVCAVFGWRRGALKSVLGIVAVVAALIGAGFVSQQGAPMAAKALAPVITHQVEQRLEESMQAALPGSDAAEEETWFFGAGLYQKTAEKMAKAAFDQARETGEAMATVALESMLRSVAAAVLFLLSFIVLFVVLLLLSNVLGLLKAVPGLHTMDALGGAALGLVKGCLILFAILWAIQFFGSGIPADVVEQTILFRGIVSVNPLTILSGM